MAWLVIRKASASIRGSDSVTRRRLSAWSTTGMISTGPMGRSRRKKEKGVPRAYRTGAPRYETYLFEERQRLNAWSPKVKFAQLPLMDTSLKLPAKLPPGATVYTWPSTSTCTF